MTSDVEQDRHGRDAQAFEQAFDAYAGRGGDGEAPGEVVVVKAPDAAPVAHAAVAVDPAGHAVAMMDPRAMMAQADPHEAAVARYEQVFAQHPDFAAVVMSRAFRQWLAQQPSYVQAAAASHDPTDAIDLVERFKAAAMRGQPDAQRLAAIKAERERQLGAAVGLPSRRGMVPVSAGVPDDYETAFRYFANQQR